MPKHVIGRNIPGAGKLSRAELRSIAQRSCSVPFMEYDPAPSYAAEV